MNKSDKRSSPVQPKKFAKILIANRGEIACRIIQACKKLGIRSVLVYSSADQNSLAVELADESYSLGAPEANQSYLNIAKIVQIAKRAKVDAVHPGYGFLSENSKFVTSLTKEKIIFIGPSAAAMQQLGDKIGSKVVAHKLKIPTANSFILTDLKKQTKALNQFIKETGFPLLIKASAGGGGKGMRKVSKSAELEPALVAAAREAQAFFSDGRLFIEKLLYPARHVEIQIIADQFGDVRHVFERDCSAQRRHQKVIEEAPALNLDEKLLVNMRQAAISLARAAKYCGAATVEFLVCADKFYFLEVNSRLQVEHPVSELISGLDLVELQIRVAQGEKLAAIMPASIEPIGVALEARLYAEDFLNDFLSSVGTITELTFPALADKSDSAWLRIDRGFRSSDQISPYYDSLLAKVIVWGETREVARARLVSSLEQIKISGIRTNLAYLLAILAHKDFIDLKHHIAWAEKTIDSTKVAAEVLPQIAIAASLRQLQQSALATPTTPIDIWSQPNFFRLGAQAKFSSNWSINDRPVELTISPSSAGHLRAWGSIENRTFDLSIDKSQAASEPHSFSCDSDTLWVSGALGSFEVRPVQRRLKTSSKQAHVSDQVCAPLPGKIIKLNYKIGEEIEADAVLAVIESMKMEHQIRVPVKAKIRDLLTAAGDLVAKDGLIARLDILG